MDKIKQDQVVETSFVESEAAAMEPAKAPEGKVKRFAKRAWKYAAVAVLSAAGGYVLGRKSRGSNNETESTDYEPAYDGGQESIPEE